MNELNFLTIENCIFEFKCPKKWGELLSIEKTTTVKFCSACERPVFLCENDEDLRRHVTKGDCVCVISTKSEHHLMGNVVTKIDTPHQIKE